MKASEVLDVSKGAAKKGERYPADGVFHLLVVRYARDGDGGYYRLAGYWFHGLGYGDHNPRQGDRNFMVQCLR